ncbi:MAG: hypothetical protein ABR511_10960 [Acidimicrobiales bacterium]
MSESEPEWYIHLLGLLDTPDPLPALDDWARGRADFGDSREELLRKLETAWPEDPMVIDEIAEQVQLGRYDNEPPNRRATQ